MIEEHCIEVVNQEGYRSRGKMFQGSVRNTFRAWRLVDLETPDGFLDLVRLVNSGSLAGVRK